MRKVTTEGIRHVTPLPFLSLLPTSGTGKSEIVNEIMVPQNEPKEINDESWGTHPFPFPSPYHPTSSPEA